MLLSTIFEHLTHGELRQLPIGGAEHDEGITEENYPAIVSYVNLALIELHTKFPLKLDTVVIQQYANITKYVISNMNAVSNTLSNRVKYVIDSASEPFLNNILKIESIVDELGETIPLNIPSDVTSILTPNYNEIQIKYPEATKAISVTYRATHEHINIEGLRPANVDIPIPPSMLQALLMFIAHRATLGLSETNVESDGYLAKFEHACNKITNEDIVNETEYTNTRPEINGWV